MNKREFGQGAKFRALTRYEKWNDIGGHIPVSTMLEIEIKCLIEDAVECGLQEATGKFKKLDEETDESWQYASTRKK